jgi:hypothetical protein
MPKRTISEGHNGNKGQRWKGTKDKPRMENNRRGSNGTALRATCESEIRVGTIEGAASRHKGVEVQ